MSDNVATASRSDLAFGDMMRELDMTRPFLERLPEDQLEWRAHPKSYSIGQIGTHIANLLFWQRISLAESGFDLASSPPPENRPAPTKEAILKSFDENRKLLEEVVATFDEEELDAPWTLYHGGDKLFTSTRAQVLRQFGISHLVHHRAQLGVYLRLLDIPLPPTYGPTADEERLRR